MYEIYTANKRAGVITQNETYLVEVVYKLVKIDKGFYIDTPPSKAIDGTILFVLINVKDLSYKILYKNRNVDSYPIINKIDNNKWILGSYEKNNEFLLFDINEGKLEKIDKNKINDKSKLIEDKSILDLISSGRRRNDNFLLIRFDLKIDNVITSADIKIPIKEIDPNPKHKFILEKAYPLK